MKKKGAMEMSVGTVVTIVLLMAVLVLGLTLTRGIFKKQDFKITKKECHDETETPNFLGSYQIFAHDNLEIHPDNPILNFSNIVPINCPTMSIEEAISQSNTFKEMKEKLNKSYFNKSLVYFYGNKSKIINNNPCDIKIDFYWIKLPIEEKVCEQVEVDEIEYEIPLLKCEINVQGCIGYMEGEKDYSYLFGLISKSHINMETFCPEYIKMELQDNKLIMSGEISFKIIPLENNTYVGILNNETLVPLNCETEKQTISKESLTTEWLNENCEIQKGECLRWGKRNSKGIAICKNEIIKYKCFDEYLVEVLR